MNGLQAREAIVQELEKLDSQLKHTTTGPEIDFLTASINALLWVMWEMEDAPSHRGQ